MELRKDGKKSSTKSLFSARKERVEMGLDLSNSLHIARLLTDLYKDPIEATVRELMSNAIDSTNKVSEEKRKPIELYLPTELSPQLEIRDYGEGMSEHTLKTVYSQYGASTKGDDFSQIGAFGLGAKAPLAYASKFSVQSVKDGMLTEVFLTSTEEGNFCEIIDSVPTDKENGTIVTVPINKTDFYKVHRTVTDHYEKFLSKDLLTIVGTENSKDFRKEMIGMVNIEGIELPAYLVLSEFEKLEEYLFHSSYDDVDNDFINLILSGFNYSTNSTNYLCLSPIYIDIIPGLFDYSSSRDEIIKNDRYLEITSLMAEQIRIIIEEKRQSTVDSTDGSLKEILPLYGGSVNRIHDLKVNYKGELIEDRIQEYKGMEYPVSLFIAFTYNNTYELIYNISSTERFKKISSLKSRERVLDTITSIETLPNISADKVLVVTDLPLTKENKCGVIVNENILKYLNKIRDGYNLSTFGGLLCTPLTMDKAKEKETLLDSCDKIEYISYEALIKEFSVRKKSTGEFFANNILLDLEKPHYYHSVLNNKFIKSHKDIYKHNTIDELIVPEYNNYLVVKCGHTGFSYNDTSQIERWLEHLKYNGIKKVNFIMIKRGELRARDIDDFLSKVSGVMIPRGIGPDTKILAKLLEKQVNFDDVEEVVAPSELVRRHSLLRARNIDYLITILKKNDYSYEKFIPEDIYSEFIELEPLTKSEKDLLQLSSYEEDEEILNLDSVCKEVIATLDSYLRYGTLNGNSELSKSLVNTILDSL